ncbi:MAG TPA: sigma-70 family RNA polymerase sigma factor [Candidatus Binatia bacterium]|nr:sigma-70 family RNA polymerase sigma factor [Candidatus Binatia bacterium]
MAHSSDELIPTRATLIQRLKNWQDQASWQEFFDTYWRLIYGVAVKRGLNAAEAQDVVQETMFSVAKHMPGFKYDPAIGSFKAWLLNMTRWRIADQVRRRQPLAEYHEITDAAEPGKSPGETDVPHALADFDKLWDQEWEKNLLDVAVDKARRRLDPKQYQIFDFYVNKEWKPERIAQAMAVSVNQVYLAKHRVTEAIKHEVQRLKSEMI